jgi:hypothetical protein
MDSERASESGDERKANESLDALDAELDALHEARKLRRLQLMMSMVMSVISQDPDLTLEEAEEMSANARRAALTMFPDKELAYDILYRPRLQRLMNERFRLQ